MLMVQESKALALVLESYQISLLDPSSLLNETRLHTVCSLSPHSTCLHFLMLHRLPECFPSLFSIYLETLSPLKVS